MTALDRQLINACRNGKYKEVELLLKQNVNVNYKANNVNYKGNDQWTALHFASRYGHTKIVKLLLANNASVNAQTILQDTALHWSSHANADKIIILDIVKMLIDAGADITLMNSDGETPEQYARYQNRNDIADYIIQYKPKTLSEIDTALKEKLSESEQKIKVCNEQVNTLVKENEAVRQENIELKIKLGVAEQKLSDENSTTQQKLSELEFNLTALRQETVDLKNQLAVMKNDLNSKTMTSERKTAELEIHVHILKEQCRLLQQVNSDLINRFDITHSEFKQELNNLSLKFESMDHSPSSTNVVVVMNNDV